VDGEVGYGGVKVRGLDSWVLKIWLIEIASEGVTVGHISAHSQDFNCCSILCYPLRQVTMPTTPAGSGA
jgi:hypothetical protein